jgi:hypothetical protein
VSAVLRVWWPFYTAFPLQRWLAVAGAVFLGFTIAIRLLFAVPTATVVGGAVTFTVLAAFPAVFAGGALLRVLSVPRSHQLLPHFRGRMLAAVVLLVASLVLWYGSLFAVPALLEGRAVPAAVFIFPLGLVTAIFFWTFLFSGDWRWGVAWVLVPLGVVSLLKTGPGSADAGSLSLSALVIGTSLAWAVFAAWYLRVRRVGPLMLTPAARGEVRAWTAPPTREAAIRAVIAWNGQPSFARPFFMAVGGAGALGLALLVAVVLLPKLDRLPLLTSLIWPFICMSMVGAVTGRIAHQSRLLWLRIAGGRDDIRQRIERAAWRSGLATFGVLMTTALIVTVPLGASLRELILGLAVCVSAAVYGGYVALASLPGVRTQLVGFGLMTAVQIALIARADPAATSVVIVVVTQLAGTALFRALAVQRWRRIDWRCVQPMSVLGGMARPSG